MCDFLPGQLILSFAKDDSAAHIVMDRLRGGGIEHVSHEESLIQKLKDHGLKRDPAIDLELHLLGVPPGQELWKANLLQFFYKHFLTDAVRSGLTRAQEEILADSRLQFTAAPNHLLSLEARPLARAPVRAADFAFGNLHAGYRGLLGPPPPNAALAVPTRVLVIDSGVAPDCRFVRNTVDLSARHGARAADDHGHGTVVTSIIHDLAPSADVTVYRVTDAMHRANEWDTLAALAAQNDAEVVNLSLAFGLIDPPSPCATCGRQSGSSRSAVFEAVLGQRMAQASAPLVVAAAGNARQPALAYPARFAEVLAVTSVNLARELSTFSNYGDLDAAGDQHQNRFALPGGDAAPRPLESVGSFAGGATDVCGTSYAAAYATGVIASRLGILGAPQGAKAFVAALRGSSDRKFAAYDSLRHGNGIMQL